MEPGSSTLFRYVRPLPTSGIVEAGLDEVGVEEDELTDLRMLFVVGLAFGDRRCGAASRTRHTIAASAENLRMSLPNGCGLVRS